MDMLADVIRSVRVGRAAAYRIKESGAWGMRFEEFTGSGFHVVLRGRGWLITAEESPRALAPGDVVFTPSGAEHGLSHAAVRLVDLPPAVMHENQPDRDHADFEFLCGGYRLDHGRAHHLLRMLPHQMAITPDYDESPVLRTLADLLRTEIVESPAGTGATRPALLDLLLTHILRQWLARNGDAAWWRVDDPVIAAVLGEIHARPGEPWTVRQLTEAAGMSRTAFVQRFTTAVGQPPITYLRAWRLAQAATMLRETDAPLATIARRVGYSTEFTFSEAFRRANGISPGRFRMDPAACP
ncbi:AraC family transcriptional regulator [Catenuloplanes sp. NPDC051500]|uniref:AraC family transcriptional regulator n=1 Tax=Catenuloplanes sp. NPDC051500 TaxID=3363959 RepID=UPI0037AC3E5E